MQKINELMAKLQITGYQREELESFIMKDI